MLAEMPGPGTVPPAQGAPAPRSKPRGAGARRSTQAPRANRTKSIKEKDGDRYPPARAAAFSRTKRTSSTAFFAALNGGMM